MSKTAIYANRMKDLTMLVLPKPSCGSEAKAEHRRYLEKQIEEIQFNDYTGQMDFRPPPNFAYNLQDEHLRSAQLPGSSSRQL
ncbi:hypothetical protein DY000_02060705 [Brassica cretica]|uniref:Uncharacterized protein n=1 Tax=Brassica cretica TaxID=69181 RepID=A0ABQ7ATV3_BRACR|nr:hypothetical protein DY000_02060705 [Brassica cretica]